MRTVGILVLLVVIAATGCGVNNNDVVLTAIDGYEAPSELPPAELPPEGELAVARPDVEVLSAASVWDSHIMSRFELIEGQIQPGVFALAAGGLCAGTLDLDGLASRLTPAILAELEGIEADVCELYPADGVRAAPIEPSPWDRVVGERFNHVMTWRDVEAFDATARMVCERGLAGDQINRRQEFSRSEAEQLMGLVAAGECELLSGTVTTLVFHRRVEAGTSVADVLANPDMYLQTRTVAEAIAPGSAIAAVDDLMPYADGTFKLPIQPGHQLAASDVTEPEPSAVHESASSEN